MTKHSQSWRKSRHSQPNGGCVEVARTTNDTIVVRDSKARSAGPFLEFTPEEWRTFLREIRDTTP